MRSAPRQSFQYSFYVPTERQAAINNLLYGGRDQQWWVPVWPQCQHVGAIPSFQTFVECDTTLSEYRLNEYAMVWESPDRYTIFEVANTSTDTHLNIPAPGSVGTPAFTDAWVMPVRIGYLEGDPSRSFDGRKSSLDLTFNVEDNAELAVADPTQYLGFDLYTDPGLLDGGSLMERLVSRIDLMDPGLGPVAYSSPWAYPRPTRVHRMMADGPAEAWAVREFLHRRKGRSSAFWQPSFENDLRLNQSGAVASQLVVRPDNYHTLAGERVHIAIETADGDWLAREVLDTTELTSTTLQLDLDTSLGGIDASEIRRISFLGLKRLDTDRAEIRYLGTSCEGVVSECSVNTVEIQP